MRCFQRGFVKVAIFLIFLLFVKWYVLRPKEMLNGEINCQKLIEGDKKEILKRRFEVNNSYSGDLNIPNCTDFVKLRGYLDYPISKVEHDYKLAYILVVYKDLKQFEGLLRSIYRKTNLYCIHVDKKSRKSFREGISNLTSCLDNVFILKKSYDVVWGKITTLLPEIDCMKALIEDYNMDWKYVINLTGQEFPLKTNYELSMITKALNGANWIEFESFLPIDRYFWKLVKFNKVPYGLTLYKGPVHVFMSREFVEFVVYDQVAKVFLDWVSDTVIPDETFYATLNFNNHILDVPGAFVDTTKLKKSDLYTEREWNKSGLRYKQWKPRKCYGFYSRDICIFGAGDIQLMVKSHSTFANKFHSYYEPGALKCLDWWIQYKAYSGEIDFDYDFYAKLDFTKKRVF